jgi:hypothetical protein
MDQRSPNNLQSSRPAAYDLSQIPSGGNPRMKLRFLLPILLLPLLMGVVADPSFATCTGSDPCYACKNCKYCKHCAKEGGACGACKRGRLVAMAER